MHPLLQHYNAPRYGLAGGGAAGGAGDDHMHSDSEMGDGTGYGMIGGVAFTRTKEKNRLAQQRFRAKQKNMVATLKSRLAELEDLVRF
ncbi:hypothetical protein OEZ85_000167 [Tetradesmus obliquus]|uniref:BZIP domain-containing protein n=1 Tax=Tetradesmus obliquus TaxID=3088 RepID=A0ABY8UPN7_TETOB|nr:hypothetical protein OEZ85_000167 [Tetradesmus obliquus]